MRFENKTVLITGGTSGIGEATARAFAKEGAKVILVGRNVPRGNTIAREINQGKVGEALFFSCDISEFSQICDLKANVMNSCEKIDVLFNNAGVFRTNSLEDMDFDAWKESYAINMDGTMYMTKTFMEELVHSNGCIINNASVSGMDSFVSGSKTYIYGSTKAAVIKFSKLCALNYAPKVRVNVICPGIIDTSIYENRDYSRFIDGIPMRKIASVDAVANVVLFLASEEAYYITGAVIPVDGGMSLM